MIVIFKNKHRVPILDVAYAQPMGKYTLLMQYAHRIRTYRTIYTEDIEMITSDHSSQHDTVTEKIPILW
jgi:hypothetical protein